MGHVLAELEVVVLAENLEIASETSSGCKG